MTSDFRFWEGEISADSGSGLWVFGVSPARKHVPGFEGRKGSEVLEFA